ncbi:hypothetical protein QKW35_18860 [Pontibacterium granulatum]|uniref:hypothetical protein n=1 Tax=Pontibacterium granulatum TaxID=2036029 RepID=UPI00249BCF4B|nr:hypothetical protein [Pontibacterium granulatum]MDI3326445.1 hypothetical protein [Pontibacterium granulatum]
MRIGIVLLLSTLITGCEFQRQLKEFYEDTPDALTGCHIGDERLSGLLYQERNFLSAKTDKRTAMIKQAILAGDHPQTALLLSQPSASASDLEKSLQYFSKQGINPTRDCPGDRYLLLRFTQTKLMLDNNQQRYQLQEENQELRKKIEALTQIEREISRDREIAQ